MQPAFADKMSSHEVNVKFTKFNEFDSVRNLENVFLVFVDSRKDIYNDKEFVRLVTEGSYEGIYVKCVNHNLFQQSQW